MILIMKILLHNEYKNEYIIINLWYPTYVYQFFNFSYNYKNRLLASFQTRPAKTYFSLLVIRTATDKWLKTTLLYYRIESYGRCMYCVLSKTLHRLIRFKVPQMLHL